MLLTIAACANKIKAILNVGLLFRTALKGLERTGFFSQICSVVNSSIF